MYGIRKILNKKVLFVEHLLKNNIFCTILNYILLAQYIWTLRILMKHWTPCYLTSIFFSILSQHHLSESKK